MNTDEAAALGNDAVMNFVYLETGLGLQNNAKHLPYHWLFPWWILFPILQFSSISFNYY